MIKKRRIFYILSLQAVILAFILGPSLVLASANEPTLLAQTPPAAPATQPSTSSGSYGIDKLEQVTGLKKGDPTTYIANVLNAVTSVLAIILVAMLVYGGATYLTSAGSEEKVGSAKKMITYAIIGIIIVAAARIIAEFVIKAVTS